MLLAYTKIVLSEELLGSDVAEDPYFRSLLFSYFPTPLQHAYRDADGAAPAAPRDHRDPHRQRHDQRRRPVVLPPALGRDRRRCRRARPRVRHCQ
ncbi:MAG: hypothetical protein WKF83_13100 [Nocardioidaceae bacterium]